MKRIRLHAAPDLAQVPPATRPRADSSLPHGVVLLLRVPTVAVGASRRSSEVVYCRGLAESVSGWLEGD